MKLQSIHCNFGCPALKNESIKVGQIINLFFYIDFMVKNCEIVYKSKAPAWAKARPSHAQLLAFGPAHNFLKPKPPKARPKPGLSGQAGASTSLGTEKHGPLAIIVTDGESSFRNMQFTLCLSEDLDSNLPLGKILYRLPGINCRTGQFQLIGTCDPKHILSRDSPPCFNPQQEFKLATLSSLLRTLELLLHI